MSKVSITSVFFAILFIALITKLFYWQVIKAKDLATQAGAQYEFGQKITAPRGNIMAHDGTWLAARGEVWRVFGWIPDVMDVAKTADTLAPYFVEEGTGQKELLEEAGRIKELLGRNGVNWVPLRTRVPRGIKEKLESFKLPGIGFEPEENRVYPEGSSAAHLLGFVGKNDEGENTGYFGLEGFYNLALSGKPGFIEREQDAVGTPIFPGTSSEVSAVSGVDLLTHIEKSIQLPLEKKLAGGIEKYGAVSGNAIVMDPKTGAIIAAAAFPSFDPAKYYDFGNEEFKNPIVSDSFEPGSVFKVIVMAAGIDAGVVEPDTICDICSGPYKIDKYEIETWDKKYHADSTMTDVLVHSDNVGMVFVANKLGKNKMFEYLSNFGFGKATEVDLQGETVGNMQPLNTWGEVELATTSFGQGIAVTPIQMVKAVAAIANGGSEVVPQIVDKLVGPGWSDDIKSKIGKRVLSEEAAKKITNMMVASAEHGESKWTDIPGFRVAGKTGTAQIPIRGHYDEEKTIASFVGFAPAEDPKFVMLVTLREPKSSQWASETAAPLWYDIASDIFMHFGVRPEK